MKITFCEIPNNIKAFEKAFELVLKHIEEHNPDLVVFPEMPFNGWLPESPNYDMNLWNNSIDRHIEYISYFTKNMDQSLVATRPVTHNNCNFNSAFIATKQGVIDIREKYYVPQEVGFWEKNWYSPGNCEFNLIDCKRAKLGVLICTEMWFMEHGREYGDKGGHVILVPRATKSTTKDKWLVGGRALAVVSGCYIISSNLGPPHSESADLGGMGFAIDPNGNIISTTTADDFIKTVEIDLSVAEIAKTTYPRNVK